MLCRTPDALQLDLLSSRHVRAEVRAKLIAKALCNDVADACTNDRRRSRPLSTPAAYLGRGPSQHDRSSGSQSRCRRAQTACTRATRPTSPRRFVLAGYMSEDAYGSTCKQLSRHWDVDGVGVQTGPPAHVFALSSPGLAAHVPRPCTDVAIEADALSVRTRPGTCRSHAPRGAILFSAALELEGQAAQGAQEAGAMQGDCSTASGRAAPGTETHGYSLQTTRPRPKSAKTVSNAHVLQSAEGAELQATWQQPRELPMATKTRMLLRDTRSAPRSRRHGVQAMGSEAAFGGGCGLNGSDRKARTVAQHPILREENSGTGGRARRRQRAPSAVEGRYLRESVLESSMQRRCQSAARQRARSATLGQQMKHLLENLERVKPELRHPRRARAQFNEELPEWDRWRSLILIPSKSFQIAQRPIRCE